MRISRSIDIQMKNETRVMDLMSKAKIFKMESCNIHSEFINLKESLPKRTPYYITTYLDGMYRFGTNMFYRYNLEFCYWINNIKYSVHRDSNMYYEKYSIKPSELCDMPCGHYWKDSDKLYFATKEDIKRIEKINMENTYFTDTYIVFNTVTYEVIKTFKTYGKINIFMNQFEETLSWINKTHTNTKPLLKKLVYKDIENKKIRRIEK